MLQLKNTTPFAATIALFPNEHGVDTLYIIVKATFDLSARIAMAERQVPLTLADEHWGEAENSSLKYAAEMHLCKPATDVALVGQAWAPSGRPAAALDVRLAVAEREKTIRVFGDRHWRKDGALSSPQPFERMPIVYERAYGGIHTPDPEAPQSLAEARNPVGVGFPGKRSKQELLEQPLPNIEDPAQLIRQPGQQSVPAGFGFIAATWQPRCQHAGTYDADWQKTRAPYLPDDFNPRFFNAAAPEFVFDRYLQGGEPVEVDNANPSGPLRFHLPECQLNTQVAIANRTETPPLNLETVLIEPDEHRLCLTWRAALPCDKQTLNVREVTITLKQLRLIGVAL